MLLVNWLYITVLKHIRTKYVKFAAGISTSVNLPNSMEPSPLQVAELYKNGWQVELFFKWFKQHLKIKKFWGATENAARIQIYSAIITYCLVATIQYDLRLGRSTYEVLQVLSISLADKTLLSELFNKANSKNDKERSGYSEPNLFNFWPSTF